MGIYWLDVRVRTNTPPADNKKVKGREIKLEDPTHELSENIGIHLIQLSGTCNATVTKSKACNRLDDPRAMGSVNRAFSLVFSTAFVIHIAFSLLLSSQ